MCSIFESTAGLKAFRFAGVSVNLLLGHCVIMKTVLDVVASAASLKVG